MFYVTKYYKYRDIYQADPQILYIRDFKIYEMGLFTAQIGEKIKEYCMISVTQGVY